MARTVGPGNVRIGTKKQEHKEPVPIPLEEALNYRDFTGRNYAGPKFPCGMCKHWLQATMLLKDGKGKPLDPMTCRKCSQHPNAPTGGDCAVERGVTIKCSHFWMREEFFSCDRLRILIHPRACAWRRHHSIEEKCRDCGQGKRMVKWMAWMGYGISEEKDCRIMQGLVEEVK